MSAQSDVRRLTQPFHDDLSDDRLVVTGLGSTRDAALDNADAQADQWFGNVAVRHRVIGRAEPQVQMNDGQVILFAVKVEYR